VKALEIQAIAIGTKNQLADQFTTGLPVDQFVGFRKHLIGWQLLRQSYRGLQWILTS